MKKTEAEKMPVTDAELDAALAPLPRKNLPRKTPFPLFA